MVARECDPPSRYRIADPTALSMAMSSLAILRTASDGRPITTLCPVYCGETRSMTVTSTTVDS
jgi:hypothetical protein